MRKDLKKVIDQTRDVEGQIIASLHSPAKRDTLWIITESDYDRVVYERFFNDNVSVRPSYDEKGNGGCDRVLRVVKHILKSGRTKRILGIRDADYMFFIPGQFKKASANLLHTDERDIEMMMLKSPSVRDALAAWNAAFPVKIALVIPIACYMGLIRIWHVARGKRENLKKYSIACAWDMNARPQRPVNHWKKVLRDCYSRITGEHLNDGMVRYIRHCYRLDDTQYGRICRGHDFVRLLGMAMVHADYSSKYIQKRIAESYNVADFSNTNLDRSIRVFARGFDMKVR